MDEYIKRYMKAENIVLLSAEEANSIAHINARQLVAIETIKKINEDIRRSTILGRKILHFNMYNNVSEDVIKLLEEKGYSVNKISEYINAQNKYASTSYYEISW